MARHGRPDEWSCPLCTLLNAWRDRRCAACDNERPAALTPEIPAASEPERLTQEHKPPPQPPRPEQQSFVYREASGVFFSSAPRSQAGAERWREEPRLRVNRRRRGVSASSSGQEAAEHRRDADAALPPPPPWLTDRQQIIETAADHQVPFSAIGGGAAAFGLSTSDDTDEDADADVPSFNLLGPGMDMFSAASDPPVPEERSTRDGLAREHSSEEHIVDLYSLEAERADPPVPAYSNGFIPASRVVVQEERAVEEKLASVGLDLSDSDSDDGEPNRLRRTKRPLTPVREDEQELRTSGQSWECPVCTNFNGAHLTSCELCDTPQAQNNECAICAKILSPSATRCDRCGTPRDQGNELIDLASSPEAKRPAPPDRNDINYDSDFENPYAPAPPDDADDYPQYLGETRGGYDSVEDISDNEAILPQSRPTSIRPDLKGFDNFVCVEDLRGDYGCKVDYRSMFTGGRTGKSYADRLVARRRESQKRKREAAKKDDLAAAGGTSKPGRQSKPKAGKKGKAPARRRASTGTKRQRKGGTEDRRSSAPTSASTVNYYDSNSLDFGEDVRTMAWEGVGSASYY